MGDAYSVVNKRIIRLVGRLLFGMAFRLSMCLHGHRWWCLWRCLLRCVFEAWRKGVASAQRSDLTSEEVRFRLFRHVLSSSYSFGFLAARGFPTRC